MKRHMMILLTWTGLLTLSVIMGCSTTGTGNSQAATQTAEENPANSQAVASLRAMIADGQAYTTEQIMPLYDQLDEVDLDTMIGTWKGGKFDGGKGPDPINWYGKRFNSPSYVEPLLARKPDGTVYSFDKWGMAQMREVKFRGKISATLIYDLKPIMDYFRKLDDNTLIGLGETKGHLTFFFYLTRDDEKDKNQG